MGKRIKPIFEKIHRSHTVGEVVDLESNNFRLETLNGLCPSCGVVIS
jgi:hypothetical protein